MSITVDDNNLQYVSLSVVGNTLHIDTEPGLSFNNMSLTLNLTMTDLEALTITGTGSIYYKGSPTINSTISGTGSVTDAN